MNYPPSGPQDPRPQDHPSQTPGRQSQPYQPQGYQPGPYGPGGSAAPNYDRPPKKNRAGLIIVLLLVVLLTVLGVGGVIAFGLISGSGDASPQPGPAPSVAPLPSTTTTTSAPKPQPTTTPVEPPASKSPVSPARTALELAGRFVAQLNADSPTAAAALGCAQTKQVIPTLIRLQVEPPTKLTVGQVTGEGVYAVQVSGTTKGSAVTGVIFVQDLTDEPLCVQAFRLTPG